MEPFQWPSGPPRLPTDPDPQTPSRSPQRRAYAVAGRGSVHPSKRERPFRFARLNATLPCLRWGRYFDAQNSSSVLCASGSSRSRDSRYLMQPRRNCGQAGTAGECGSTFWQETPKPWMMPTELVARAHLDAGRLVPPAGNCPALVAMTASLCKAANAMN
jgi:hypothetical protein